MEGPTLDKTKCAISLSRIDFDKHTEIILDANRLLPHNFKIDIRGFENRIYTKFSLLPKYPEWKQSIAQYPRTLRAAFNLCENYRYLVDMSVIKGDGGGTQYTFLEGIDANAIPILNSSWIIENDIFVSGDNCFIVKDGKELADLVKHGGGRIESKMLQNAKEILQNHQPDKIGKVYLKVLKK